MLEIFLRSQLLIVFFFMLKFKLDRLNMFGLQRSVHKESIFISRTKARREKVFGETC